MSQKFPDQKPPISGQRLQSLTNVCLLKVESSAFAFVCLEISNLLKLDISTSTDFNPSKA